MGTLALALETASMRAVTTAVPLLLQLALVLQGALLLPRTTTTRSLATQAWLMSVSIGGGRPLPAQTRRRGRTRTRTMASFHTAATVTTQAVYRSRHLARSRR